MLSQAVNCAHSDAPSHGSTAGPVHQYLPTRSSTHKHALAVIQNRMQILQKLPSAGAKKNARSTLSLAAGRTPCTRISSCCLLELLQACSV